LVHVAIFYLTTLSQLSYFGVQWDFGFFCIWNTCCVEKAS